MLVQIIILDGSPTIRESIAKNAAAARTSEDPNMYTYIYTFWVFRSSEYPEISFAIQEETMINLFGEITGTGAAAQAWQIWVKGSDRVYGAHDVTLLDMFEGYMQLLPSPIIWVQTSTA